MVNLSRLEEIKDLRTVWPHEALDFTPWLSQDDNIVLLADAVGLDITVDETEPNVGDFNVDIFASETGTDRKIIIENQLEDTNHDHLGKLITYDASGKSADVIIWVVKHAREEHKAAIEWLSWLLELVFNRYKSDECLDKTNVQGDFSVIGSELINFISTVLTCRLVKKAREAGLLNDMSYGDLMDDLNTAWRMVDAPDEPETGDRYWVHTLKTVFDELEALGLSTHPSARAEKKRTSP